MYIRPSPFFCLASTAFSDIGLVGLIEKQRLKKQPQEVSELEAPVTQDNVKS